MNPCNPNPGPGALLAEARDLADTGFALVPVCKPRPDGNGQCFSPWHEQPCSRVGKRPLAKGYPAQARRPPTAKEIVSELESKWPCGLAIVTGAGVVVVEGDSFEAEAEIEALAGSVVQATPARERRPGRGRGYLFKVPEGVALPNRAHLGNSKSIDARAEGGIFVVPSSLHPSGHIHRWVRGRGPSQTPLQWLPKGLASLLASPTPSTPRNAARPFAPVRTGTRHRHGVPGTVAAVMGAYPRIRALFDGTRSGLRDSSRSGTDFALAVELLRRRVGAADIVSSLMARSNSHRRDPDYAARTVARASEFGVRGRR